MAHILWLSSEMPARDGQGGQRRQFHQIRSLRRRGHEITLVVPRSAQTGPSARAIATVRRPLTHVRGHALRGTIRRMRHLVRSDRWDVIVVSHPESCWILPEDEDVSTPVLLDVHNVLSHWHREAGRSAQADDALVLERRAIGRADAVMTCSALEHRRLGAMHPHAAPEAFAAPLGVDPDEWPDRGYDRADPIVALFGSWGWRPNALGLAWFLEEVWPGVRALVPDARALVAGSGVGDWSRWPDGARFVGRVDDLAGFASGATVVAVPVQEGVGASLKFAEALASGAAVIATPDGANAFERSAAFVATDPAEWARWIADRLLRRTEEPAPAPARETAFREHTWDLAVAPIDAWIRRALAGDGGVASEARGAWR
jgi:polysaccharide biosynthesis protein PslH